MEWKTLKADGCTWQVRSVARPTEPGATAGEEVLEFTTDEVNLPARRVVVSAGSLEQMDETALRSAYMRARPIGGDHYGRPGKHMGDVRQP